MGYDPIEVNQAARKAARAIRNGGGAGYVEYKNAVCFPEAEFEFSNGIIMDIPGKPFAEGDSVTVTYDGVQYVRTAKVFPYPNLASGFYVGNIGIFGAEDTGEPFALLCCFDIEGGFIGFIAADAESYNVGDSTHRMGCSMNGETIHPIDPKYLPGVCLPVVELSTTIDVMAPTQLTETEMEQIKRVAETSDFALVCCKVNTFHDIPVILTCKNYVSDTEVGFIGISGTLAYVFGLNLEENIGMAQIQILDSSTAGEGE